MSLSRYTVSTDKKHSVTFQVQSFDIQLSFQKSLLPYTVHTVSRQSSFFPWEDAEYSIDIIFQHIMLIGKACRLLVRECRVAVCKKLPRRAQHFCEKNAAFPWTWCNLYCFKFRESSKCAAFFRNDKHFSESKRHPFTKISPVTYIYIYKYIHIHVYDVHMRCMDYWKKTQYSVNKQCSSTLCNFTLERVLDYNISLKEYHWLHVGMFFQETSWQRSWGKRLYKIMAPTLFVWK